jgi:mRNA interferase RelE/StbE
MHYELIYHPDVKKVDLQIIDNKNKFMIKKAIEERLSAHPEIYGKPLQRTLKGYWRLRIGDYRVVFKILEQKIVILGILHRKDIYRQIQKRDY